MKSERFIYDTSTLQLLIYRFQAMPLTRHYPRESNSYPEEKEEHERLFRRY